MFNEFINAWLKIVGCRPRYRYLITLEDPASEYKNWWEMIPYLKDESFFRSWPSGHMTKATIMLTLPMVADVLKCKQKYLKSMLFAFAIIWLIALGYNRIHMNYHFLSDVCFGVLISYCLYALTYKLAFSIFRKENQGQT
jgi:membrane-associated phospholipid phosphatase